MLKKMVFVAVLSSLLSVSTQALAKCPADCIIRSNLQEIAAIIQSGKSAQEIQVALMAWSLTNIPMNPADYEYMQFMGIYNSVGAGPLTAVFNSLSPTASP